MNQWNNLQDRLNEGGFTTAALKPKQEERLQEKLEAANLRFQELYWNVRDELGYLEVMRHQLAEVLYKQAVCPASRSHPICWARQRAMPSSSKPRKGIWNGY
ncbi:MAG: hypothetical protein IV090_12615 [Candidatus Sericytochromatia bacterium]|nr:hypothetical protein [Candidatus Sericytochromatia bacterium]